MSNLTPIPQNFRNNVNWILGAYTDAGVTFPNGFQKDAIQNAVGARKTNKWRGWSCDISIIENTHGCYLVVEDSGTVGLTGDNTPAEIINQMMARDEELAPDQRLSRFTSMFNSGGNSTGGGLFGAGKSVYSVASQTYTYYFDSLREDGKYVANINKSGQVMPIALEDDCAKEFIFLNTGLQEKTKTGTRVIIEAPHRDLVDSIVSGDIVPYIQESWWLIIQRFDETSSITVNGNPVLVPNDIKCGTHNYELQNPETFLLNYKVKHFGLFIFEKGENRWKGISYYRKGMKIGEIDLKDIPEKIIDKYWGYVEVDEAWEDDLAEIEDKVHFGVSKGKKARSTYQNLKNYCNEKIKANLVEWGFIKDIENEDKKLKDELKQIAENIQDLFDKLGFEDLGKGPQKSDFDVRWYNISYPFSGSERVTTDDKLSFSMRINSSYLTDKKFEFKLYVMNPHTGSLVSHIVGDKVLIKSNSTYKHDFSHKIDKINSIQYSENRIMLSVKVIGSGKEKIKELPYFYDIDRPENQKEIVTLSLHECSFPTKGSRRINFEEKINSVCYRIENKRNHELNFRLNISLHNANDPSCPKIVDVATFSEIIKPFEDTVTNFIDEIQFPKAIFEQHLSTGVIELRARLVANEDYEDYEKGDKITFYNYKIFLNCDEKSGKNDAFEVQSILKPDDYRRSWYIPGSGRKIFLNIGHAAYLNVQDSPNFQHEYLREQMMKQYVLLYLGEGKYDMFVKQGLDFTELEPHEAADEVLNRIEHVYALSFK